MQEKPYVHVANIGKGPEKQCQAFFALTLDSCPSVRLISSLYDHEQDIQTKKYFQEQIDFINALYSNRSDLSYALRIISKPNPDSFLAGQIQICLLGKIQAAERTNAIGQSEQALQELLCLLGAFRPDYYWHPIADRESFMQFWRPFDLESAEIAEIRRREDFIPFDTLKTQPWLGRKQTNARVKDNSDQIYFVHNFSPNPGNFLRFLRLLLLHKNPVMLQVTLQPTRLTEAEETRMMASLAKCEQLILKFFKEELPNNLVSEYNQFAKDVLQLISAQCIRLQDAPFLMTIAVASPDTIPGSLLEALGVEITAPISEEVGKQHFDSRIGLNIGGYDVCLPASKKDKAWLDCKNWGPSLSPPALRRLRKMLDANEAACAFRFPFATTEGVPGMEITTLRMRPAPNEIALLNQREDKKDLTCIGENIFISARQKVYITDQDRQQHLYLIGQTGTGKTTLMKSMIYNDICSGKGLCVIDPHGDLYEELLGCIPEERLEDVVLLDPTDTDFPVGLNLLQCKNEEQRYFIVREVKAIMEKLLEDQYRHEASSYAGPLFYQHMQMNMLLAMSDSDNPGTLLEFYEIFQQEDYYKRWLPLKCKDRRLQNWVDNILSTISYNPTHPSGEVSIGTWVSSKFEDFLFDPKLRLIFGQKDSSIDLSEIMESGKILLVNLAKGELSEANARFLGMVLMAKIQSAAMERVQLPKEKRKMFYLYVDEFQALSTINFMLLLSEARKFGISIVLANQFISQIKDERIIQSIFGNVGTIISFRLGHEDASHHMQKQFLPYFDEFDLITLPNWYACVKASVQGQVVHPFLIRTLLTDIQSDPSIKARVIEASRRKYGRPRSQVENEIEKAIGSPNKGE